MVFSKIRWQVPFICKCNKSSLGSHMWSNCPWCKKSGAFPLLARRDFAVWSVRALFPQFFQPWNSSSWLTAVTFSSVQPALSSSSERSQINTEHLLCIPWKKSTAPKYLECWAGCLGGKKVSIFFCKSTFRFKNTGVLLVVRWISSWEMSLPRCFFTQLLAIPDFHGDRSRDMWVCMLICCCCGWAPRGK